MSKLEMLSMLTAHGIDPLKPIGGLAGITQMDIAASVAKLDDREYSLLMAKYCLNETATHKAWAYWFAQLMDEKEASGWELEKGKTELLATVTLAEHLSGLVCKVCAGVKSVVVGTKKITCENCAGS